MDDTLPRTRVWHAHRILRAIKNGYSCGTRTQSHGHKSSSSTHLSQNRGLQKLKYIKTKINSYFGDVLISGVASRAQFNHGNEYPILTAIFRYLIQMRIDSGVQEQSVLLSEGLQ